MNDKKIVKYYFEVGNDNGNSEHDINIDGISIEQPNVIAKIRKLPMLDEINIDYISKKLHDNLLATVTTDAAEPGIYFSGKYALKSGEKVRNIEVGVDNNKLNSDLVIINTLERIAAQGVKKAYDEGEDLSKIEIIVNPDMTTALPVTQYSKKNSDEFSNKFMDHNHIVIVHVGIISVKVTIKFEFVKTLPESVPATFSLQSMVIIDKPEKDLTEADIKHNDKVKKIFKELNEDSTEKGFIDGNFFKGKRILHVGIGEGTTEYPLTDDIAFEPNFIHGSNNGIGHAIDKALPEFKEELGLISYSRQSYSDVLKAPGHKYHDLASEIVEQYIEEESEEILHNIKTEIQRANNDVDILCIYGGGSILMKKHLKSKLKSICDKANITLFYVPAEFAVTLESEGMYEFTRSELFKAIKAKYLKLKEGKQ